MEESCNFVLAFGGTGARCAETLAYLAATRAIRAPMYILLVDPDENNGNTQLAADQLARYHRLHALVDSPDNGSPLPFFSTALNVKPGDVGARDGGDSFFWKYGSASRRWREIIGYRMGDSTGMNGVYDLLYDESDMEMSFEKGYVGRSHIGALDVFLTFRRATGESEGARELTRFLTQLESAAKSNAKSGGARLVVVGSIFGGTGASGMPAIPPFLGEHPTFKDLAERDLRVGCVQIAPYFSFSGSDDPKLPDSRLHPVVTQSALFHYGTTPIGFDRVYLVGSPEPSSTNAGKPVTGGKDQLNRAHYVELAAGLAIAHFFREPPSERLAKEKTPDVFASYSGSKDYADFPDSSAAELRRNLVSFATACALHAVFIAPDLANRTRDEFMKVMQRQSGSMIERGNTDFEAFTLFARRFLAWLIEVNERAPELLTSGFAKSIRALLDGPEEGLFRAPAGLLAEVAPNGDRPKKSPYDELLHDRMNTVKLGQIRQSRPMGFYLELLTRATDGYCKGLYQSW